MHAVLSLVMSAAPGVTTATISSGQSISAAIDLGNQRLHRIAIPSSWTSAAITFQTSADGVTFNDLYLAGTGEYTLTTSDVAASRSIVLDQGVFLGVRYLKVRSGTSASPVSQAADRALTLVTVAR